MKPIPTTGLRDSRKRTDVGICILFTLRRINYRSALEHSLMSTALQTATFYRIIASALLLSASIGTQAKQDLPFNIESVTAFDEPWAMAFLPDGHMLVTEKKGSLSHSVSLSVPNILTLHFR